MFQLCSHIQVLHAPYILISVSAVFIHGCLICCTICKSSHNHQTFIPLNCYCNCYIQRFNLTLFTLKSVFQLRSYIGVPFTILCRSLFPLCAYVWLFHCILFSLTVHTSLHLSSPKWILIFLFATSPWPLKSDMNSLNWEYNVQWCTPPNNCILSTSNGCI